MSLVSLPQELYPKIFFNLNFKDLCQLPFVSNGLNELFSKDEIWRNLFFTNFPNDPLLTNETAKKQFLAKVSAIPVMGNHELSRTLTCFLLNLKWNKKRELICTFPNEPTYSLQFSVSFGPDRGTKEGSNGNADETEYYKYLAPASYRTSKAVNYFNQVFTEINGIPFSITHASVCRQAPYNSGPEPEIGMPFLCVDGKIPDVDVGFGNTLGYFSEVNEWKRPFKLFCITDSDSNKPVWVGLIPLHFGFKFVSIDAKGAVTWEHEGNRHIRNNPFGEGDGNHELIRNLQQNPIRFS